MANDNVIWRGNTQMNITKTESLTVMEHHANKQIDSLRKQATLLMEQVKEIQNRVDLAHLIARAKYNFKPVLMKEYYLYKELSAENYTLTLVSPEEWGDKCPYGECTARVRQLGDSTWEEVPNEDKNKDENEDEVIEVT